GLPADRSSVGVGGTADGTRRYGDGRVRYGGERRADRRSDKGVGGRHGGTASYGGAWSSTGGRKGNGACRQCSSENSHGPPIAPSKAGRKRRIAKRTACRHELPRRSPGRTDRKRNSDG